MEVGEGEWKNDNTKHNTSFHWYEMNLAGNFVIAIVREFVKLAIIFHAFYIQIIARIQNSQLAG